MSKTISYRGQLTDGISEKISLATLNGKTGYKIKKFQIIDPTPGQSDVELVAKIYNKDPATSSVAAGTVDFTESSLMAISFYTFERGNIGTSFQSIFDNEMTNQDIFLTATDSTAGTKSTNYYLELETVALTDLQSTQITLKSLRTIASR
mgnify:FL=1